MSELLDHMLRDAQLHPDVALVNGISVLLTLLEVRKGRCVLSCHTSFLFLLVKVKDGFYLFLLPLKSHLSLTNDLLFLPTVEREKNQ